MHPSDIAPRSAFRDRFFTGVVGSMLLLMGVAVVGGVT